MQGWGAPGGAHGHRVSQAIRVCSLLSRTDYKRPTEAKANGRNGPATLDSDRNLISGTVVPPNGIRRRACLEV